MKHLTEEQIQEYLDGSGNQDNKALATHLYLCAECRKLYEEYQRLYLGLAKTEIPELSPGFSGRVMAGIESESPEPERRSLWVPIFALANIVAGLAAILYFVDFSFLNGFFAYFGQEESQIAVLATKLSEYINLIGFDLDIILTVGLAIIAIGAIDYLLRIVKKRPAHFVV